MHDPRRSNASTGLWDCLAAGEGNIDLILGGLEALPELGKDRLATDLEMTASGSTAGTASLLARLGVSVGFVGRVGRDAWGEQVLEFLLDSGVDTEPLIVDPALRTGITVAYTFQEDRAFATYLGSIAALRREDLPDALLSRARHLHVGAYYVQDALRPTCAELFRRSRELGLTTSLDTGWDPRDRWTGEIEACLPHVDLFFPNETEAVHITGCDTVEAAVDRLCDYGGTVVTTLGAQGALLARGATRLYAPTHRVAVADTTSAGDAFNAGFLYGFLRGWEDGRALRLATACGALAVTRLGNRAFASLAEVERFAAACPLYES